MPDVVEEQKKPAELITFKKSDQAHFVLGFRAFNVHDKRRFTLEVLADILGGGMSSRLFKKVRGELGAAYYVYAENELDTNSGVITASAGTNINKTEEVIKVILKEFKRFKKELVPEKELKKSKEHITGRLFLALETSGQLGGFYTGQRVERMNISTAEEIAKKINKVTAEDIKSVAKELFVNKGLNLALVGPFKNRSFLDILKV
jgi:predicted Zn-dependent peptidase